MLNQKGFSPILIVIIVALVIIGGYLYFNKLSSKNTPSSSQITPVSTVTPKPAADWKTYMNTKYNFSIDYPDNWSFREFPDSKNGASFNPVNKPGYPDASDSISISAGKTNSSYFNVSFEAYVKVAANQEIQNYNKLASIKKITTNDGVVGYETTWMVQPPSIGGHPPASPDSESSPITYFELPGDKTSLIRITLGRDEDIDIYEKMLKTVKIPADPNVTPTPTADEKSVLEYVMKKYIALKHNSKESSLTVTVSKIDGNYAKGGVSDEGGGGMWFAEKEDGLWQLVWDGNGTIDCSTFTLYPNFSKSMIPECWDDKTQKTVKR